MLCGRPSCTNDFLLPVVIVSVSVDRKSSAFWSCGCAAFPPQKMCSSVLSGACSHTTDGVPFLSLLCVILQQKMM